MDPLRIVSIGGGTGLSTLLSGLKRYAGDAKQAELTAVVTVTDDGGSSGRLRRDFDVLPPGDIRNCMVALSEDEALLSRLFQYRFGGGSGLRGHSFGNLFLTALTHLTGDFPLAVRTSSEILAIRGCIFPATAQNVTLTAELVNGAVVRGETRISRSRYRIRRIHLNPEQCTPLPETLEAIEAADLITFGPGSLFTSIVPNVLVQGIPDAVRRSRALKACFINIMWQPGETIDFRASDHIAAIAEHGGDHLIDAAVLNTRPISEPMLQRYAEQRARPVVNDAERIREMGIEVVEEELLSEGEKVRHDPDAIAAVAMRLACRGRQRRTTE
ncbi:MAG TPA: uridine diphosphate-N-acetylglucosamine-binding protein YvcK [Bryobacteraceae bacterium]|nr:uridine diphosphate-N-acetylglucosamine-binding protein YvcK [Bryobacteraceae bacterium]